MAFVHPESGRFLRVNDALCRLLGRSREQLMALTVDDVAHPEDRANGQEGRRAMVNGNASSFETEKRYVRPDGEVVWTALSTAPVRRPDGCPSATGTRAAREDQLRARLARRPRAPGSGRAAAQQGRAAPRAAPRDLLRQRRSRSSADPRAAGRAG